MMKKIISLLLVLAMIFSLWIPAFGEEGTGTETTVYQDIGDGTTTINPADYYDGNFNGTKDNGSIKNVYASKWVSYNLNFINSGVYVINIRYTNAAKKDGSGTIKIDGVQKGTGTFPYVGGSANVIDFCTIAVDAGQHELMFVNGDVSLNRIKYFNFIYLGTEKEYIKSGDDCGDTSVNPSENFNAGSSATYTFDTELDGTYGVYAAVGAQDGEYEFEGDVDGDFDIGAQFYGSATDIYLGTAVLSKGTHEVTITNSSQSSVKLQEIKLQYKYVSESETKEFMRSLSDAGSRADLDTLFAEYNDKLAISYAHYLSNVFSKEIIYSKLLRFNFATMDQFSAKFMELYNEEIKNPFVEVVQGGNTVTELEAGAFTVIVNPRLPNCAEVIIALYNDDYTELKGTDKGTLTGDEPLVLDALTAEAGYTKLKVFFLEDTENLKPSQLLFNETAIFVSPDGSDSNNGLTPDKPVTLNKALTIVPGINSQYPRNIVIYLMGGEYVLDSTIEIDDTLSFYDEYGVSFVSLDEDNPAVISGGYEFTGWTDEDNDGIYKATLPSTITDVRQLYINDYPAQRARSDKYYIGEVPLDDEGNNVYEEKVINKETGETAMVETSGLTQDGFSIICNPEFPELKKPQDAELAYINKWALQRLPVKDIEISDEHEVTVWMQQPYYMTALTMLCGGGVHPTVGCRFYVENDLSLLDECGEFYYDKDTRVIYYKPFPNENLQTARTVIGKTEQLFRIIGSSADNKVKNISFNNIKFRYGGYYTKVNEEGAVTFQAENLVNAASGLNQNPISPGVGRTLDAQILVENAENIEFKDCDISLMGTTALRLGSGVTDSSVTGCIFTDVGGSALSIGTWDHKKTLAEDITLKNNVISRTGFDFMFCPAISIYYCKNISTLHNTIAHIPYTAISVNWGWAHKYKTVEKTVLDENGNPVLDEDGKEIKEEVFDGTNETPACRLGVGGHITAYNRIYDISRSVKDGGHIYNLGYLTEHVIHDNYITDSPDLGGIYMDTGSSNVKIRNNVMERCEQNNIRGGGGKLQMGNVAENNWADDSEISKSVWDGNYFEELIVKKGDWPDGAKDVINNAGVEAEYEDNLTRLEKPLNTTFDHMDIPKEEGKDPNVTYVNCDTWARFFRGASNSLVESSDPKHYTLPDEGTDVKYPVTNNKYLPKIFYLSGYPAIGNFNGNDCIEYEITVPKDGKYTFTIDHGSKNDRRIYVFIDDKQYPLTSDYMKYSSVFFTYSFKNKAKFNNYRIPGQPKLTDDCYVPHEFLGDDGNPKTIELKGGTTYYLRLANTNSFSFSRFRLKLVEETK